MAETYQAGCWIETFELSHFRGRRRRLYGPAQFQSLRSRLPEWGISIDSIILGPDVFVRFFRAAEPENTVLWLIPREAVEDLAEYPVPDDVDSLQLLDRAPAENELGYAAYRGHLEKLKTREQKPAG